MSPTPVPPELAGHRVVVTGASDGLGRGLATALASMGAEVVLPVRNATKGDAALAQIRRDQPDAQVSTRELDLASLDAVHRLADRLAEEGRPISVLINNAGLMTPPTRRTTSDGFELQLGTNHLGHFALTGRLLPLLQEGQARVTHQISIAASRGAMRWDDLQWEQRYQAFPAYAQSKLAVGLFGLELDRRARAHGWGLTSNIAHPGVAATNLFAAQPEVGRRRDMLNVAGVRLLARLGLFAQSADAGMLPSLMAATDPITSGGRLYGPKGIGHLAGAPREQTLSRPLRSEADAARLWDLSQELTGVTFPG